jgi:hypothetical protein
MRLPKTPRKLAAFSFIWTPVLCAGILVIDASYGFYLGDLWSAGSGSRVLAIHLVLMPIIATAFALLLFSSVALPHRSRLALLVTCGAIAIDNLLFAEMILIAWLFPLWFLVRFYREGRA